MNKARTDSAPCIVLGVETQIGLSVVRELGQAGVPVIGIAHNPGAIGLASRYLRKGVVVPEARSADLLRTILQLRQEHGPCCLMTVSETNLAWLNEHRAQLTDLRLAVPTADTLARVLDKQRTLQAAREVGIEVPETAEPQTFEEARQLASIFKFPAVLKWKDPHQVASRLHSMGLPLRKAEYVYSAEQWLDAAARYAPVGVWPMVQTYCPGQGLGQFLFMHQGQAVRRFQHLRIAEWPPEGGFSSVCDALPLAQHGALQDRSIALLQHIGWQGVAMVEYRWDANSGRAVLMEINGRYWGSFPLAVHCGARFAFLAYLQAMGLPMADLPAPRQDLRCRMVATEVKRLHRILWQPGLIADRAFNPSRWKEVRRFLVDFMRPRVRYYVWSIDDPMPFVADVRQWLVKLMRR